MSRTGEKQQETQESHARARSPAVQLHCFPQLLCCHAGCCHLSSSVNKCTSVVTSETDDSIASVKPVPAASRPVRRLSPLDCDMLRRRHKVENVNCRLDKFKRIFCRVDQLVASFEAFNMIALMLMTLKAMPKVHKKRVCVP